MNMWIRSIAAMALVAMIAVPVLAEDTADTGITLPAGFTATVFGDDLGPVRHITVRDDGTVYGMLYRPAEGGSILALRDEDGDGKADITRYFGAGEGSGMGIHDGYLYFSTNVAVLRYRLKEGEMVPSSAPETVISGFPEQNQHAAKTFTFDDAGHIYVSVGAPSNACQEESRTPESPGMQPCPQLVQQAAIWRYGSGKTGQVHPADGHRYATGIRNGMALDWNGEAGALFFASHGRDQLQHLWYDFYSEEDNAELPAEEFHRADDGSDHGWPYTYWDPIRGQRMVGPEYGGDGQTASDNAGYSAPLIGFPGHWAPNGLKFYTGEAFPKAYRGGAFLAFHGSWNRSPLPQGGYNVVFIPFAGGAPTGDWSEFAVGFTGQDKLMNPGNAAYRPTGLAVAPDGALYIGADQGGRIWRVTYKED
jgi:glucose/arabinose dehydrogenase